MTDTEVPAVLSLEDIQARIAEKQQAEHAEEAADAHDAAEARYKFVRPLTDSAEGFIDYVTNPEGRLMMGLPDVDAMTRGFARGEMVYVAGRSHSGKTQLVLNAVVNNPDRRFVFFTPDEVSEVVLSKLISIKHGVNAETLEARIKAGDPEATELVRSSARRDFANVIVIDETLSIPQMTQALNEAQDYWGERVDAIVYDFLELLPGDGDAEGVSSKSKAMKRWLKHIQTVGFIIHQNGKSSAPFGKPAGMDGMRYGGDTEAIFVLEVYRKKDNTDLDDWDRRRQARTVSVNLCKNKRPPSKKGECDLFLDPETGFIRRLHNDDLIIDGVPITTIEQAHVAQESAQWKF